MRDTRNYGSFPSRHLWPQRSVARGLKERRVSYRVDRDVVVMMTLYFCFIHWEVELFYSFFSLIQALLQPPRYCSSDQCSISSPTPSSISLPSLSFSCLVFSMLRRVFPPTMFWSVSDSGSDFQSLPNARSVKSCGMKGLAGCRGPPTEWVRYLRGMLHLLKHTVSLLHQLLHCSPSHS